MARAPRRGLAAAAAAVLLACARPGAAVFDSTFSGPETHAVGKPSALVVTLAEKGVPARGAEAAFVADMAHPGMVPVVVKASETAPGRYEAAVTWTMAGDWSVLFEARGADGRRFERRDALRVAR